MRFTPLALAPAAVAAVITFQQVPAADGATNGPR